VIQPSSLLYKPNNRSADGLCDEVRLYPQSAGLKYSVTMFNPNNSMIIVNKNLDSGERAANYIDAFGAEFDLDKIDIFVSRETIAAGDTSVFAQQPFMHGSEPHSLNYKFPLYFTAGYAVSSSGVFLASNQRDIILNAVTKNATYVQLENENATGLELFNTVKHLAVNGKPLKNCLITGIYPSKSGYPGGLWGINRDKLVYDTERDIYHISNNYSKDVTPAQMSWGLNRTSKKPKEQKKIVVIKETTDFSDVVKEEPIPVFMKDDILQISFLSHNTAQPFCQIFEVTYTSADNLSICVRRGFGYPVDTLTKKCSDLDDQYVDIFTGKLV
jgi:hypothetical protein